MLSYKESPGSNIKIIKMGFTEINLPSKSQKTTRNETLLKGPLFLVKI